MAQNQGTVVGGTLRPNDSQDKFPIAFNKELKGGFRSVLTIAERDSIYLEHREEFMQVRVVQEDKCYELKAGLTNGHWVEVPKLDVSRKIESLTTSPEQITKIWNGTQDEFIALKNAGLLLYEVIYNYVPIEIVVRNPAQSVSYLLTEFDNDTIHILKSNCNLRLPTDTNDFKMTILVYPNVTVTVYQGNNQLNSITNNVLLQGDKELSSGKYDLIQEGDSIIFVLC